MLRWLTAGESHGPALVGILEGLPAGVSVDSEVVRDALARRRLGYGRGARMKFEKDQVSFLGGVRHGKTQGGPIAIEIGNTEWPKWERVMNADPVDLDELASMARNAPLTRPRPGHADFTGMQKYGFDDARPVLERASARETVARVALGSVAQAFLAGLGIELVSHTTAIGAVAAWLMRRRQPWPTWTHWTPIHCVASMAKPARQWFLRSMTRIRQGRPSAVWLRCSPTTCLRASAPTCTGIAA